MPVMVVSRRSALALTASGIAGLAGSARAAGKEIVLGGVFALTGPVRLITEPYQQGVMSCFAQVNKKGGIGGRPIKWLVEDDAYQPARSLAGAKKLVERDEVAFLFGQLGTQTTAAIVPYAEQARVPFFTGNPVVPPYKHYTFGFMAPYSDQTYQLVNYLVGTRGVKRVAYLYQNDDLGEVARRGIDRAMGEKGMELAGTVGYERGTTDFATQILTLKKFSPEAVISIGTAPTIASGIQQSNAAGFRPTWGTYGVGSSNIMQSLLGKDIEGLLFASEVLDQFSDDPEVQAVKTVLQESYPQARADWATMLGYGHARMIVEVLEAVGPDVTREKVMSVVESDRSFPVGVMKAIRYGKTSRGGATAVRVFQWQGDRPQPRTDWMQIG